MIVARHQRRWCALVAYSGDSGERLLPLPPGRWDEAALCDWLTAFIGRGSELDVPVREMPRIYAELKAPPGVTDLVFNRMRTQHGGGAAVVEVSAESELRGVTIPLHPGAARRRP